MSDERAVQEVLARYVRAADARDRTAMGALFTPDGFVEIHHRVDGEEEKLAVIEGPEAIGEAIGMMEAHPLRGWSHHTTHDHLISVDGDKATIDAQFVVFRVRGAEVPEGGWPEGTMGLQGRVEPIESGYYRSVLRRDAQGWSIAEHRIHLDMPFAIPAPA